MNNGFQAKVMSRKQFKRLPKNLQRENLIRILLLNMKGLTHFPYEIWKRPANLVLWASITREYGGQEYGVLENTHVVVAFCRQDSGLGIAFK